MQNMLKMLLYSNVWPMALHLYEYFYQQRDPKEHYKKGLVRAQHLREAKWFVVRFLSINSEAGR